MLNIYRASAGSGKTFQLTKDYIFLLFDALGNNPRPHRRILAVTFTNKATAEMKSRILKELHALSAGDKSDYRADLMEAYSLTGNEVDSRAKKILTGILHDYSSFSISTIDKFFQQVVRSFAREIGVSGGYNIELDTSLTLQQALDNLYGSLSDADNKQLLAWMTDFLQEQIEDGRSWRVDNDIMELGKEIFKENYQHKVREIREKLHDKTFLQRYRKKLREIISAFENNVVSNAESALLILARFGLTKDDFKGKYMFSTLERLKNKGFSISNSFINYAESAENCYSPKQTPSKSADIDSAFPELKIHLDALIDLFSTEIVFYNSAKIILRHISTLGILADLASQISKLTSEQNIMLLSDTNLLLNKIIDNSETPFVYERTGVNIDHYMIDEFQDTSAMQWKNFLPLVANSLAYDKKNMLVGDVKQSIYRWRNSDWKLLDTRVNEDFSAQQTNQKTLETNWRSDRNIIRFNNLFFKKASVKLQEKLNDNINEAVGENPELQKLSDVITHAYSDVEQQVSKHATDGYVQLQFLEKDGVKEEWQELVLAKIPILLENLVDRGFKPNDIAFLVRNNVHATTLTNNLITYKDSPFARPGFSYEVVGSEGLMIASSPSVNFIIAVLRLILNPQDDVSRTIMQYEYQVGKLKRSEDEAVRMYFEKAETATVKSSLFSDEENACLNEISRLALYEATEKLISTFNLEDWHQETVFLQAFQDVIFKFVNSSNADLNSFLRWWDENCEKQFIDAPENENAFRVMTIHKSKGLDFKVVIVPFCSWSLDASAYSSPLLWCETEVEPFNELPLMPVKYSSGLKNTIFQNEYFDEQMHQFVDNLNLAYVAFTRARNEMYCFCELPKPNKSGEMPFKSVSDLLYLCLNENPEFENGWNEEGTILEVGEPTLAVYKEKKQTSEVKKQTSYPITDSSKRLKIKHTSADYWKTVPISESRVNYGTIMHEILQKTIRRGDEEKAIAEQVAAGKITGLELSELRKELARFWSQPEVNEWFAHDVEVLNENPVLLPTGEVFRPDRVILRGNAATVIDYKFGEEERTFHTRQLKQYVGFLKEMGYDEVQGKIYYVVLGKVVELN